MAGPEWLSDSAAVLMVVTSVYCAARLVVSRGRDGARQRDVDALHVVMGVVMAGMLVGWLSFGWNGLWKDLFGLSAAWFGWRSLSALIRSRTDRGSIFHPVGHVVTSGAMCAMFVAAPAANAGASTMSASAGMGGMGGMGGMAGMAGMVTGSDGARWWPAVAVLLAIILFGFANWYLRALILAGARPSGAEAGPTGSLPPPITLSPRLALWCEIVMSLTMGYMLILLR
jgi:hypothetical protein